jgi:hypothetical protein
MQLAAVGATVTVTVGGERVEAELGLAQVVARPSPSLSGSFASRPDSH